MDKEKAEMMRDTLLALIDGVVIDSSFGNGYKEGIKTSIELLELTYSLEPKLEEVLCS